MKMVKAEVSSLSGAALDWAVAKCERRRVEYNHQYTDDIKFEGWWQSGPNHWQPICKYSTDWAAGGPIIDRQHIYLRPTITADGYRPSGSTDAVEARIELGKDTKKFDPCNVVFEYGPTHLVAAMRCYVASNFGDTVVIPEELFDMTKSKQP